MVVEWTKLVWQRRPVASWGLESLPVLDSHCGHLANSMKDTLKKAKINLTVIPWVMTSQLQPLNVTIYKLLRGATQALHRLVDWTEAQIDANGSHQTRITRQGGKLGLSSIARCSTRTSYKGLQEVLHFQQPWWQWELCPEGGRKHDIACRDDDWRPWNRYLIVC